MKIQLEADRFRDAMRMTASGVAVITTDGANGRAGVTVSTFQSFSMEPPSVMVCIHGESQNLKKILENNVFAANVLAAGQQGVARIFAGASAEGRGKAFDAMEWRTLVTGAPVLREALCSFDCRVADVFAFASHRIVIGAVQAIEIAGAEPLIYSGRSYHQLRILEHDEPHPAKGEFIVSF